MGRIANLWMAAAVIGMAAPVSAQLLGGTGGILNGGRLGDVTGGLLGQSTATRTPSSIQSPSR